MAGTQEEEDHLHKCSCVAAFIAQDPDGELFTFRKFARLGARNLLRLQRDIQRLERKTDDFARRSCARRDVDHRTPLSNPDASRPNLDGRGDSQDQTNVELELQRKLEQYRVYCSKRESVMCSQCAYTRRQGSPFTKEHPAHGEAKYTRPQGIPIPVL